MNIFMKKIISLCGLLFLFSVNAIAQSATLEWVKGVTAVDLTDQQHVRSIDVDSQGNVYAVGTFKEKVSFDRGLAGPLVLTSAGTSFELFYAKFNASGDCVWAKKITNTSASDLTSVKLDGKGNMYFTGTFSGTITVNIGGANQSYASNGSAVDIMVAKLDTAGNFAWVETFGSAAADIAGALALDEDDNVYVTGNFKGNVNFGTHGSFTKVGVAMFYVLKFNNSGDMQWAAVANGSNTSATVGSTVTGLGLASDRNGHIYITGVYGHNVTFQLGGVTTANILTSVQKTNIFVMKLTTAGALVWAKAFESNRGAQGNGITVDPQGNVYSVGIFKGTVDFDPDPSGKHELVGAGSTPTSAGSNDAYISKLDANGHFVWAARLGNTTHDDAVSVSLDAQNNIYTTGYFSKEVDFDPGTGTHNITPYGGTNYCVYIWKLDPDGKFLWVTQMGSKTSTSTLAYSIAVDKDYNIHTAGKFSGEAEFSLNPTVSSVTLATTAYNGAGFIQKISQNICTPTGSTMSLTDCDSITVNGQKYTSSGSYYQTYVNSAGCDSVLTLNLDISHAVMGSNITNTACDSFVFNGVTYNTSGTYTQVLQTVAGCDSTVTLDLTINQSAHTQLTERVCDSYTLDTATYTKSGVYTHMFQTAASCDSLVTLDLTILNTADTISETACKRYIAGADTFTQSGIYTQAFTNTDGCDSLVTIDLTIDQVDVSVTRSGLILTADLSGAVYQWLDCDNGYSIIPNAVQQIFAPEADGNYAVAVSSGNCTDTSACYVVTGIVGVGHTAQEDIKVFPNPASSTLYVTIPPQISQANFRLLSLIGETLLSGKVTSTHFTLDISNFATGVYLLEVNVGEKISRIRIVKD